MTIPPADNAANDLNASQIQNPKSKIQNAEEFRERRKRLRAACPDGIIVIRGATEEELQHGAASVYRQNSSFFYLTGVESPGALLILLPENVPATAGFRYLNPEIREFLFLPARDPAMETWTGTKLGTGTETEQQTGIEKTADASGLWGALAGFIFYCPLVYFVAPFGEHAVLTREYALMEQIRRIAPIAQFRDVSPALAALRVVKSASELDNIRQAIAITAEGQKAARQLIANGAGRWEYEIEARVFEAFRSRGALLAFPTIAGAGVNGTVLHYEANNGQMRDGELVVVDIGAKLGGYAGDLTRTYPVGGKFSSRQREIYALVLEAHKHAISGYQPGIDTLRALTDRCKAFLKDSSLRAKNAAGNEATMETFMPHGLTHHLGLDVHDVGDRELPLKPNQVITIEPGIYIPSEGIGVRIEDDYLVTANGLERLGPYLEREIEEIEALMSDS